jgi:hypothetical protein
LESLRFIAISLLEVILNQKIVCYNCDTTEWKWRELSKLRGVKPQWQPATNWEERSKVWGGSKWASKEKGDNPTSPTIPSTVFLLAKQAEPFLNPKAANKSL